MEKPTVYVIKTNYADSFAGIFDPSFRNDNLRDKLKLEEAIQDFRTGPIIPNIELHKWPSADEPRGDVRANIHKEGDDKKPGLYLVSYSILPKEYSYFREIVLLQEKCISADFIRERLPKEFTHFDLIFDFDSNKGFFEPVLEQMQTDFTVKRITIRRPKIFYKLSKN